MITYIIAFITLILLVGIPLAASLKYPKYKDVYFNIIDDFHHSMPEDLIAQELKKRYKLSESQSKAAILAAKDSNIEWFEKNIK